MFETPQDRVVRMAKVKACEALMLHQHDGPPMPLGCRNRGQAMQAPRGFHMQYVILAGMPPKSPSKGSAYVPCPNKILEALIKRKAQAINTSIDQGSRRRLIHGAPDVAMRENDCLFGRRPVPLRQRSLLSLTAVRRIPHRDHRRRVTLSWARTSRLKLRIAGHLIELALV